MKRIELVTHPCKLNSISDVNIIQSVYTGPIGMMRYILEVSSDRVELFEKIAAIPFSVVIQTDVLECFSKEDFEEVLSAFLLKSIYSKPDAFETIKYQNPRVTHIYPLYIKSQDPEYLYMCEEEQRLVDFDPLLFLGLKLISSDSLCWEGPIQKSGIKKVLRAGDLCLIDSTDLKLYDKAQLDLVLSKVERLRRDRDMGKYFPDTNQDSMSLSSWSSKSPKKSPTKV